MSDGRWHPAAAVADLDDGTPRRVEVAGRAICLAKVNGEIFAIDDSCTHEEARLSDGHVWTDTCEIECPRHDSTFDLRTGWPSNPPATEPIAVHHVRIIRDHIEINL